MPAAASAPQIGEAVERDAYWSEAGLDPEAVIAATSDERWKAQLAAHTEEAIAEGVFGLPMVTAEGKLFFGNDRLELLDGFLAGPLRP